MKLNHLLAAICLLITSSIHAQPRCGFDELHQKRLQTDASYKAGVEKESERIRQAVKQIKTAKIKPLSASATYIIPVVVHVIHTGDAIGTTYNPSDAQIEGAIDYLNSVYAGTFPGIEGVGDMQIQFALAQRDPNCNATTGITRTNGTVILGYEQYGVYDRSSGIDELELKDLIRWDPSQYYNIWVVNKIDGADGTSGIFTAGYAYFPGAPSDLDGTIMLATQMKTGAKTLPHEIGHALFLHHPFQGSNGTTCVPATSCATNGDEICDTDPISQPSDFTTCRTGQNNPCTNTPYTINTENNFMNYTSCFNLFTADQKTRALAAITNLPSRISLANSYGDLPPDEGPVTCDPKIDFELANDLRKELTTINGICRDYTDYTYKMLISKAPSATTIATLTLSGTATEKVDYDITTNGSFSSPSKQLTFISGLVAEQTFSVRIYNDAIVDGTETLVLGFSLNNGGGDAEIGYTRPGLTISILDNDKVPTTGPGINTAIVGINDFILDEPFDAMQQKQRSQFLYYASELTNAGILPGQIRGISFYLLKNSTRPFKNVNIKMTSTTNSHLYNNGTTFISSGTVVKTLSSYETVDEWNTFNFDDAFEWDGTSNIVIEICFDNGSIDNSNYPDYIVSYQDGSSSTQSNFIWRTGVNCAESFNTFGYYSNGAKPFIAFDYGHETPVVQADVNTSKQEYLGPYADVYFYDQTDNKLLARIKNLSGHDYGCTTVEIDRAGTNTSAFTSNATSQHLLNKTFKVTPTNNNSSGNYDITLYYTDAEKIGWESTTGQIWNNILLVKAPSSISSYSPVGPNPNGLIAAAIPTLSTLGTQHGLTATFTTGFSGFGAGIPVIVLPVRLSSLEGNLVGKEVKLNWTTSFEQQVRDFEIEKSTDGSFFTKIGTVKAAGNSSVIKDYSFIDKKLAPINYYRLRMNDVNGANTLSKVLTFKYDGTGQNVWLENTMIKNQIIIRSYKGTQRLSLQLVDNNGIIASRKEVLNGSTHYKWELGNNLARGVYIVQVLADDQMFTFKIIKD